MSTMQVVFSIIGLVAIVAVVAHGMWTLRKNEQRQRQLVTDMELKRQQASRLDDGVGEVRVIAKRSTTTQQAPGSEAAATTPEHDDLPTIAIEPDQRRSAKVTASPTASEPKLDKVENAKAATSPAQQSMDLPIERAADEPLINDTPDEVIVLHVVGDIQGTVLLQQMTELGFKFGEFDIFHRHVDTAGNGPVLFSLANMYNPGKFVIEQIETFQTDGVALFLALPIKSNSLQAFTMMHNAAVKLAQAIGKGQVLDEHRNLLTRQAQQHIHQRIREYERKRLIRQ